MSSGAELDDRLAPSEGLGYDQLAGLKALGQSTEFATGNIVAAFSIGIRQLKAYVPGFFIGLPEGDEFLFAG